MALKKKGQGVGNFQVQSYSPLLTILKSDFDTPGSLKKTTSDSRFRLGWGVNHF